MAVTGTLIHISVEFRKAEELKSFLKLHRQSGVLLDIANINLINASETAELGITDRSGAQDEGSKVKPKPLPDIQCYFDVTVRGGKASAVAFLDLLRKRGF